MAYRIQLTRYGVENINWLYFGAYRMRVEVTAVEGAGLDRSIFIYRRVPISPYTGVNYDDFCAVAGPAQMADVPIGEPDANRYWPFYRLDYVELDFTSPQLAEEVWNTIKNEARILCEGMGRYSQLAVADVTWVPDSPPAGPDQSESASQSL